MAIRIIGQAPANKHSMIGTLLAVIIMNIIWIYYYGQSQAKDTPSTIMLVFACLAIAFAALSIRHYFTTGKEYVVKVDRFSEGLSVLILILVIMGFGFYFFTYFIFGE